MPYGATPDEAAVSRVRGGTFSRPTIGCLVEAEGIMKGRALYNTQSADYRARLEAWTKPWGKYSGCNGYTGAE